MFKTGASVYKAFWGVLRISLVLNEYGTGFLVRISSTHNPEAMGRILPFDLLELLVLGDRVHAEHVPRLDTSTLGSTLFHWLSLT